MVRVVGEVAAPGRAHSRLRGQVDRTGDVGAITSREGAHCREIGDIELGEGELGMVFEPGETGKRIAKHDGRKGLS